MASFTFVIDGSVPAGLEQWIVSSGHGLRRLDESAPAPEAEDGAVILTCDHAAAERLGGGGLPMMVISPDVRDDISHVTERIAEIIETRPFVLEGNAIVLIERGRDRVIRQPQS